MLWRMLYINAQLPKKKEEILQSAAPGFRAVRCLPSLLCLVKSPFYAPPSGRSLLEAEDGEKLYDCCLAGTWREGLERVVSGKTWGGTCHLPSNMAALKCRVAALQALLVALLLCKASSSSSDDEDRNKEIEAARKESKYKSIDTTLLLMLMGLLILSVLTIWLFKVKRFRFMHETGVCMLYGKALFSSHQ